jgi:hypothetical protein
VFFQAYWLDLVRRGVLATLTVADLKVYLSARGLKTGGNKAEIVDRIATDVLSE